MADSTMDEFNSNLVLETSTTEFKQNLKGWREILIYLHSILIWKEPAYPALSAGVVSFVFLIIWSFDVSLLTTASVVGIVICLLDYFVPIVCVNIFDSSNWSETQENEYEKICSNIALLSVSINETWKKWQSIKENNPKAYFVTVLSCLIILAWIGNIINNLLLTYFIVLFGVMSPGLVHKGLLQEYYHKTNEMIKSLIGNKEKSH